MRSSKLRLLVLGVDGASYSVVARLLKQNRLPALARLAGHGMLTRLQSTFPPHTAPAWASIFTGVNPGQHGIYQFWQLQAPGYSPPITTVRDFAWEPLWHTLSRWGHSVGIYNVPMSHPPQPIKDGFMITWPLTPTINYSYPRDLVHVLARNGLHHHSDMVTMYREGGDYLNAATEWIQKRTDTLLYLIDQYPTEVLIAVYTELDRVSHYYWSNADEPGEHVNRAYECIDAAIGRLLEALPSDLPVAILSDHGFGSCVFNFQVNELLRQAGLLVVESGADARRETAGPARFFEDSAAAFGNANWFACAETGVKVNWSRTRAYMPAPGCFGINVNLRGRQSAGIVDSSEQSAIECELQRLLTQANVVAGEAAFDLVPRANVYRGRRIADAPDYLLMPRRWDIMPHPAIGRPIFTTPGQKGIHQMDGIFLAANFEALIRPATARVEDVTPTLLAQLGLPVSEGVEGVALRQSPYAFTEALLCQNQNSAEFNPEFQVAMENRLRDLGYL